MKKILYIILFAFVVNACDNGFEELNVNPTKPIQIDEKNKFTAIQLFTSGGIYENWRANLIYCSTMIQHIATTDKSWSGDKYTLDQAYASSMIDRIYGSAIKNMEDMLIQLNKENKPDEMKAIARIMRVFIYHRITDLYGNIPYSEAGQALLGNLLPKYDEQSVIYPDMLKELEESVAKLGSGTSDFGAADIMYQGSQEKWKRFGNSMILRLGLRLIKVDPAAAKSWVTKAISGGVMESNDDTAYIQHTVGPEEINKNGNGEVFSRFNGARLSKTFVDILKGDGDPRLPILGARRSDGSTDPDDQKGLPNGLDIALLTAQTGEEDTDAYAEPNSIITGEDSPMFFQTYAEVEFMLAEATVRWGLAGNPEEHYNAGVTAAMKMLSLYGDAAIISDSDITTYLSNNPYDPTKAIEQINTQYWASTFLNEYEAFANWRRTGFPVLVPVNYPGNVTNGTIPRRLTYPTSEQTNNTANYEAVITAQGPDKLTTRVWWDK